MAEILKWLSSFPEPQISPTFKVSAIKSSALSLTDPICFTVFSNIKMYGNEISVLTVKKIKYIYLFKRISHDRAKLVVKKKMWNAEKIEKRLHQYFRKSRFTMTDKIKQGQWAQAHIKIGISKDADRRLQDINNNIFKSGSTEWFAMHIIEQLIVHALIRWYAYRWILLAAFIAFIWYGNS